MKLTQEDNGQVLNLAPGAFFEIALSGNPTSGYQWEGDAWNRAVVDLVGEPVYLQESPAIGSGGEFTFRFRAVARGRSMVRLHYRRPFEAYAPPKRVFEITVAVN